MTLFIGLILVYALHLPWWLYVAAVTMYFLELDHNKKDK